MIRCSVQGQELIVGSPVIAADSINYLTAEFIFRTSDWDGLTKIAHFSNGKNSADIELVDDRISSSAGLNLSEGVWTISLTGHAYDAGTLVQRITTTQAKLTVKPSAVPDGEPIESLPSYGEQILGAVEEINDKLDSFTAEAETLPAGSEATASYDGQHFLFGIPAGPKGEKGNPGVNGVNGTNGADGFSPSVMVSKSGRTTTITITDKNRTTTANVFDGTNGRNGVDGFSPTATVEKVGNASTITITDKNGMTTATVYDDAELREDVSELKTQLNQRGIPSGGSTGQSLRKKSGTNYDVEWADVGLPTDEQTADAVSTWLDDHPEATTTVQDNSLAEEKFTNTLKIKTIKDYVMPEMFGATGDGITDDSTAVRNALKYSIDNNIKLIIAKKYRVHGSILTSNDYNTARLNIEGLKAIQTPEYRISNAATCGISFDDGADLFNGLTLGGSISRVSFTPQSRTQTGSIFKNCTLKGFVFNECTVSDIGAICHNTNAKYLSKFQNSYFLSIKYFAKCDGVASFYECTDSQICNNYINGDGSPESHCFEWTDYIHSSLLQNFIDYFQTIFYPVCSQTNKAFILPNSIGNDYQVFRYLYYRTNNVGVIFFNSNSDRFAETDADSMPDGDYSATKTKMRNYAMYKSKIFGAAGTPHAGETIEDDLLPYIMYIDDRCQVSIQNAIISLYTRNLIYVGTSITVNQWSKAELTINRFYYETGNSYDNCVQECSIGFWNGGPYKQNTINIPFIKNYQIAPTTSNFAYFECYLGEKIKVGNTVSRFYAKNMTSYLKPDWYDITALL